MKKPTPSNCTLKKCIFHGQPPPEHSLLCIYCTNLRQPAIHPLSQEVP